jgi:hypothetical protein
MAIVFGMSQPSPLYQLVETRLGEPLADWVATHYPDSSWRLLATKLSEQTGLTVNAETLRLWFAGRIKTTAVVVDAPVGAE